MFKLVMVMRIFLAALFAFFMLHDSLVAAAWAGGLGALLHHFRTFDVHGGEWSCAERFFNTVMGIAAVGTLLFCIGQAWLGEGLQIALATLFAWLAIGGLTYPIAVRKTDIITCCRGKDGDSC